MEAKILKCTCNHDFQDKQYGKQFRLHNPCGKSGTKEFGTKFKCSICLNIKIK